MTSECKWPWEKENIEKEETETEESCILEKTKFILGKKAIFKKK